MKLLLLFIAQSESIRGQVFFVAFLLRSHPQRFRQGRFHHVGFASLYVGVIEKGVLVGVQ